jgi:transposase
MVCLWYMTTYKHTIQLSHTELSQLQAITRKGKHNSRVINRARILLCSNNGMSKSAIAKQLYIGRTTVQNVRSHYHTHGINRALYEAPRPGQPKKLNDKSEAYLVAIACSDPPEGRERWTLDLLKKRMVDEKKVESISDVCILSYLKNRKIKPWVEKNVVRTEAYA